MSLLRVANLRLSFKNGTDAIRILRGVDLEIQKGQILGLVGESGSGKSLTGLSLLGLAGERAEVEADELSFDGVDLLGASTAGIRALRGREISMVFQNPTTSLDPHFRIGNQLEEVLRHRGGLKRSVAREKARSLLIEVGLDDVDRVMRCYPHELSGGMNQRVMIALAIALEPNLVIADEPTTALDVTTQGRILELFKSLAQQRGMSLLFISHDLGVIRYLCDSVAVMYAGGIVECGPTHEVLVQPAHPYTRALLASRPSLDEKNSELIGIDGRPPAAGEPISGCAFAPRCAEAQEGCTESVPKFESVGSRGVACHLREGGRL